jgi:aryl-alcohol dehydrogenase-like predicted oxidoreductase
MGLGCWQIGGDCWGDLDETRALEILKISADGGVTFFDTADVYGAGRSESLIGKFIKSRGEKIFVATKLGRGADPGWPGNGAREVMIRHTEESLRRLGVEALDLTQLHCVPLDALRQGDVFDTLRELKQAGKIRQFGASVESMEEALVCLQQEGLASLQIIFNIFRQKPVDVLFDEARRRGVAIIVRLPLASGLLSGKMTAATRFAAADHRTFNRNGEHFNVGETFAGLPFEEGVRLADELKAYVPDGMTMAQMALRWILDHEAVSVVIPGASRPDQAIANLQAGGLPALPESLHAKLREFYLAKVASRIRGPY